MKAIILEATREKKREILDKLSSGGKIFSVKFVKKDKTVREMTCKKWVEKHLTSGDRNVVEQNTVAHKPEYFTVSDIGSANAFRNINLDTLMEVKAGKDSYIFQ